jgi:hypothetical protein
MTGVRASEGGAKGSGDGAVGAPSHAGFADVALARVSTVDLAWAGSTVHSTPAPEPFRTVGAARPSDIDAELDALPLGAIVWQ